MVEQLLSDGRGRRLCRPAGLNRELLLVRVGAISDRPHLNRAHVLFGRTLCAPTTHEQSSLLPPVSCLLVKKIFFKKRIIEKNDELSFEKKLKTIAYANEKCGRTGAYPYRRSKSVMIPHYWWNFQVKGPYLDATLESPTDTEGASLYGESLRYKTERRFFKNLCFFYCQILPLLL